MISAEERAEIRRLFYAEHWKVGTIAQALGVHPDTVRRAIEAERFFEHAARPRPTKLDAYLPLVRETLVRYPRLCSTRLYEMLRPRGYTGSVGQLRRAVRRLRPEPVGEAYLRLRTMPGEQAQADWGAFGWMGTGRARRPLSCFVMVLSWSRAIHALFTLDQTMESFVRGHVEAFGFFGGAARAVLYDNLKSAVLSRRGDAIQFHPRLLELCGHYHYAPRPCAPHRGNEKGRVERQIQYLRTSFFAARSFHDVDDLNAQFRAWRQDVAHARRCPEGEQTVGEALERERAYLLPLPEHPFASEVVRVVRSGKTPYVRFDRNLYSIPYKLCGQPLTLVAGPTTVRLLDRPDHEVAQHVRSWATGEIVEDGSHIEALVRHKHAARELKGRDRLRIAAPETDRLFDVLALRGENLGGHTSRLLSLLDDYGAEELRAAVQEALGREAFSAGSVGHILEQRRRARGLGPPIRVELPNDPRVRELRVRPHDLGTYDDLGQDNDDDGSDNEAG